MIKFISLKITNKVTMLELLKESIEMFNNSFIRYGIYYQLNPDLKFYTLKPSKKSGKPDKDLPSI